MSKYSFDRAPRPRRDRRLGFDRLDERIAPANLAWGFNEPTVAAGLVSPTAMELTPDGRIFVTEQTGAIRVVENGQLLATPFATLTVDSAGERGLLGITIDPNFTSNRFVYVYYTTPSGGVHNRISRFTASGNVAAGGETVLVDLDPLSSATNHNGGAIHFGHDGKLYVGVGENANPANSQSLANRHGKILRYEPDGSIPIDNPTTFAGISGSPSGANRAIWAVGLRNPFTFAVQPGSGRIFINDVGQNAFEEINDGVAGRNFGWPNVEGVGGPGSNPAFTNPLFVYGHGPGTSAGFAISGGAFAKTGASSYPSDYAGDYFFADFVNKWIRRYDPTTGEVDLVASDIDGFPVDMRVDGSGNLIYLARNSSFGGVIRGLTFSPLPESFSVVGAGPGGPPVVKIFDPNTGALLRSFNAYNPAFTGGVQVAQGDFNRDGVNDIVTGPGTGGGPHVRVFDGQTGKVLVDLFPYPLGFTGGVFVAAGDVDSDGVADLITGAGPSGGPNVKIIDGDTFVERASFMAYDPAFTGGVRVAAGDIDLDGFAEVVTGAGTGGGAHVRAWDGRTIALERDFFAFSNFFGGLYVAVGDVDGDGRGDIIVGQGTGGTLVRVFDGANPANILRESAAYGNFTGGVRVGVLRKPGSVSVDVITGAGTGGGPHVRIRGGTNFGVVREFFAFDFGNFGGIYVG